MLSSWREKTSLCSSQKPSALKSLWLGLFAQTVQALHFSSAHLLGFFQQIITWCSISIFVHVLDRQKWPQVLTVPASHHHFKEELSGQSYFTVVKCLCLISCFLGSYRILLISLWEQRHAGVCFCFKSQLLQQLTSFFTLPQCIRKEASSVSDLIKLLLHFNFIRSKKCSPVALSFNQRPTFSSSVSYFLHFTLYQQCRKAANVIKGRAGMKRITCNLLLSNRAWHTGDSLG